MTGEIWRQSWSI